MIFFHLFSVEQIKILKMPFVFSVNFMLHLKLDHSFVFYLNLFRLSLTVFAVTCIFSCAQFHCFKWISTLSACVYFQNMTLK